MLLNDVVKTVDPTAWIVEEQVLSGGGKVLTGEHRSTELWWNGIDRGTKVLSTGGMIPGEHRSTEKWWNGTDRGTQKY